MSVVEEESLFEEINTEVEAQNYIQKMIERLKIARSECNTSVSEGIAFSAERQRRANNRYRILYGRTLGSLVTLMHCRKLSNASYVQLRAGIIDTANPSIIGSIL